MPVAQTACVSTHFITSVNKLHPDMKKAPPPLHSMASLAAQAAGNPPATWETWVLSLGRKDPMEDGTATHSRILTWRNPQTEEPAGYSPRGHKESNPAERLTLPVSLHSRKKLYSCMKQAVYYFPT